MSQRPIVKLKNHKHGAKNPKAQFPMEITIDTVKNAVRVVEFHPTDGSDEVVLLAWVSLAEVIGEFLATGPSSAAPQLRSTIESLRSLTSAERQSFIVSRIRVVEALEGETLRELAARTLCVVTVAFTATLNDLDSDSPLRAGQLVKIIRDEPLL